MGVLQKKDNGRIARIVDVVVLNITRDDGCTLVEASQSVNGTARTLNRLPAVKQRADENEFLAAHRCLSKVLQMSENCVNIRADGIKVCETESTSQDFCGLPTHYQKRFINAALVDDFQIGSGGEK